MLSTPPPDGVALDGDECRTPLPRGWPYDRATEGVRPSKGGCCPHVSPGRGRSGRHEVRSELWCAGLDQIDHASTGVASPYRWNHASAGERVGGRGMAGQVSKRGVFTVPRLWGRIRTVTCHVMPGPTPSPGQVGRGDRDSADPGSVKVTLPDAGPAVGQRETSRSRLGPPRPAL